MATPTIKGTYSLDQETVKLLDRLARRWRVTKSEALRRSIRSAAAADSSANQPELALLDQLQAAAVREVPSIRKWAASVREERRASRQKRRQ
ncbi:MAG: ribbon-helix-helix protein, CopG family [Gemmatimonadota bacterium]